MLFGQQIYFVIDKIHNKVKEKKNLFKMKKNWALKQNWTVSTLSWNKISTNIHIKEKCVLDHLSYG